MDITIMVVPNLARSLEMQKMYLILVEHPVTLGSQPLSRIRSNSGNRRLNLFIIRQLYGFLFPENPSLKQNIEKFIL
jgi:hypothetical protein